MKLHIITIGRPKLPYAARGWDEYLQRLKRYHQVKITHLSDRKNNAQDILAAADNSTKVGLVIEGKQQSSEELAGFLDKLSLEGREVSFLIGGPEGLPPAVINNLDHQWS